MTTEQREGRVPPASMRLLMAASGVAIAAGLLWLSLDTHLERACLVMDTPYLPLCTSIQTESDAERQRKLRVHLAENPGDSDAWIRLTNLEPGAHEQALLRAASTLAPTEPNVLMWRAGAAITRNDLVRATELLLQLIEYRGKGEAAEALARLVASGDGTALLRPHLTRASKWLPQVLGKITALKLPLTSALPLLAEASAKGAVPQPTIQAYIRALKVEGQWADAHALWIAQLGKAAPLLFNGSFEQRFQSDGFDWEVTPALPSRAGAVVGQRGVRNRGQVLEVQYTGKPLVVPIIRQYLFVPPGRYLLRGQYMTMKLRTEQGLAWAVRCSNAKSVRALPGRSDGLQDTAGAWRSFGFEVTVAADCGPVASLQLETFAPFEAAAGFKGRASFDSFELIPQRL